MTVYPSGKLKFCAPPACWSYTVRQFRVEPATPVLQTTYKLETLDRRERMGSVRKRRKAGRGTGRGKEATTNLKLSADSNERQLAQRSLRTTNVTLHTERSMSYELETADRHQAEAQGTHLPRYAQAPPPASLISCAAPPWPYQPMIT